MSKMLKLLARWFTRPTAPIQVQLVRRDVCRLTMAEWRANPTLVGMAGKILHDPNFLMMLDVLRNEHISRARLNVNDMKLRAAVQLQGEGYTTALDNLEALGTEQKPREALPTTYADPLLEEAEQ